MFFSSDCKKVENTCEKVKDEIGEQLWSLSCQLLKLDDDHLYYR